MIVADRGIQPTLLRRNKGASCRTMTIVFLFDVDNTLLDNDHVTADLKRHLQTHVGPERAQRYWQRFEEIRSELGYADYLGALQRYRMDYPHDPNLLTVSYFLMRLSFCESSVSELDRCRRARRRQWGPAVILSDGDVVFQPHKVYRSGLFEAVRGQRAHLRAQGARTGRCGTALSRPITTWWWTTSCASCMPSRKSGNRAVTTVFVRQGHYATIRRLFTKYPPADISLERIGNLLDYDLGALPKPRRRLDLRATALRSTVETIVLRFLLNLFQVFQRRESSRRKSCRHLRCRRAGRRTTRSRRSP